ncbi:Hpt domain-containing protein [Pseudomonas sp. dw_358]|uniref:Hpt domain-containing protein n=1 Tax=Pseudomonas sp. dw_358 TaxID=2720083 RepID=UPI0021168F2A|nr:Hpt domain-containing protein [Pseudomonas sp. dw_358]
MPDYVALRSVVTAMREELVRVKDQLDLFVLGDRQHLSALDGLLAPLRQVADTLAVLGFGQPRKVIIDQLAVLQGLAQGTRTADDAVLLDVAGALLYVEATLAGRIGSLEPSQALVTPSPAAATTASMDLAQIHRLVIAEVRQCLRQVKERILDHDDGPRPLQDAEQMPLAVASELLTQARGALAMLSIDRAAALVRACRDYIDTAPARLQSDDLMDALSSIDYYLDQLSSQPNQPDEGLLDLAEDDLMMLGYEPAGVVHPPRNMPLPQRHVEQLPAAPALNPLPQSIPATLLPPSADPVLDDELRDVFLEECGEVMACLHEQWPLWQRQSQGRAPLAQIRRAFHTLKGSGRMVGALVLGELAWALENLLNRLLESQADASAEAVALVEQAMARLPALVKEFAKGQQRQHDDVDLLAAQAHLLAARKQAVDSQLQEIFQSEAQAHLDSLARFLQASPPMGGQALTDDLIRALHTLRGSAHVAGAHAIAALADVLDQLAREYKAHQLLLHADELQLLSEALVALRDLLGQDPGAPAPELLARLEATLAVRLQGWQTQPNEPHRIRHDPQLITGFLAQGMDILLDAESLLQRWREHPGERQELTALLDELTTLGHGAHLADLHAMDELCEALLDLYGAVEESSLAVSPSFFDAAHQAHDGLIDMLDQIAAGQQLHPCPQQVQALRDLLAQGLEPGAMGHIGGGGQVIQDLTRATRRLHEQAATDEPSAAEPQDPIVELFLEEAADLLDSADEALLRWLRDTANGAPLHSLQRDLHTLKGGARLADIAEVADLGQALEGLYEGLVNRALVHSPALQRALLDGHERLSQMLDQLQLEQPLQAADSLIEAARLLRLEHTAAIEVAEPTIAEEDTELLEIFLEEGFDLLDSSAHSLKRWRAEPGNVLEVENLLRDLHTLKGGARMVEASSIGDLVHELEFIHEKVLAGTLQPDNSLFNLLQQAHDRLAQMLDALRSRLPVEPAQSLIQRVRAFDGQPLPLPAPPVSPAADVQPAVAERGTADLVKVAGDLLEDLGNMAGETSLLHGRVEQQVNDAQAALHEMDITIERMREQLRQLDTETQGQILSRRQIANEQGDYDDFDPLEMDRHSPLQELSRALFESASDLVDLKETLMGRNHEAQMLLAVQSRVNTELQEGLMRTRMVPFERMVPRLQRVVRQVAAELGKQVELEVGSVQGEMDRSVLERMLAPLEHMLRNAVDHGLESAEARLAAGKPAHGTIHLDLLHEGSQIIIVLADDGAGVPLEAVRAKAIKRGLLDPAMAISDHDVLQFILQPGFSTAAKITQISGRGLGMDVVHEEVKQLGGSMTLDSKVGQGARFVIRLPFTVSVNRALLVHCGEEQYAVGLNTLEGMVRVMPDELEACYQLNPPRYEYAGRGYDLRYLGQLLGGPPARLVAQTQALPVLLVHAHDQQVAVQVDAVASSREIVVKGLGPQFASVPGLSGATILGDGKVVLILDLLGQIRAAQMRHLQHLAHRGNERVPPVSLPARPLLVMVVDDSITVRKVTSRLLERHGMHVLTARDGVEAMSLLEVHGPDVLLLDIEMPRMDGFEVATRVRQHPRLKDLPIIMITSRTGPKHRERAMAIGVNDYLGKPFQETRLLESIAQWSHGHA